MTNSLLVNGLELIGQDVNPEYRLAAGLDFGTVTPDTTTISSLYLDGDTVSGERTGNKTWQFGVQVFAPDRSTLSLNVDTLLMAVKPPAPGVFPVVWTPDGGASLNFTGSLISANVEKVREKNDASIATVTLTFVTGPFGQSTGLQTISVAATGGPAQLVVDAMDTSSPAFAVATRDTTHQYLGASCMAFTMSRVILSTRRVGGGGLTGATINYYGYTSPQSPNPGRNITSTNLSAYQSISMRFRWDQAPAAWTVAFTLTLRDSSGVSAAATVNIAVAPGNTGYYLARFSLSKYAAIDLTAVTTWWVGAVTVGAKALEGVSAPLTTTAYADDERVYPPGSSANSTAEGAVLTIPGVIGSARCAVGLQLDIGGVAFTDMVVHRPPVDQDPDATILAGIGGGGGSVTIPAANANYNGRSYSVIVLLTATPPSGTSRTLTVTFTQKIGSTVIGGPTALAMTTTSSTFLKNFGEIELPLTVTPPENQSDSLVISATSSDVRDVIVDVLLLDTKGQTAILQIGPSTAQALWLDAPGPLEDIGPVYGAATVDRTQAYSLAPGLTALPGGPIQLDPGDNRLLVASVQGAPNAAVTYPPTWLDEALL